MLSCVAVDSLVAGTLARPWRSANAASAFSGLVIMPQMALFFSSLAATPNSLCATIRRLATVEDGT